MIDGIKIFDAHTHHLGRFKRRDETLVEFLDRFNIDKAVVTTLNKSANLNAILNANRDEAESEFLDKFVQKKQYDHEEVRKMVEKNPDRLVGFYWFNPRIADDEDWKLLEKYIVDYKFKGVKTQCYVDMLKIPEDLYLLAEFCIDKDIPLFLHSGSGFFFQKSVRSKDYYKLVRKYKDLKVILGHAAFTMEYAISLLKFFAKTPNVFFETSVSIPYGIMTLIKAMGSHRVMYGSDAPTATSPDIEIDKIRILNLDERTLEDVFYNTINNLIKN